MSENRRNKRALMKEVNEPKKRTFVQELEYRLGVYFALKSGAMYVKDEKLGSKEELLIRLESEISQDIIYLSRKSLGEVPEEQDFKSLCVWYKTKLMKK